MDIGDCIAQLIPERIEISECILPNELPTTKQVSNGFGFTRINSAVLQCNEPMIVAIRLKKDTTGSARIDSGASTQFIAIDLAVKNNLPLKLKPKPETPIVVDGKEAENQLTDICTFRLTVHQDLETLTFQVTKLADWNMILRKTWLKRHNLVIN